MAKKKKQYLEIMLITILLIAIVGISYAAFSYTGTGQKLNTITTGAISMEYVESTNVISMNNALPTTDSTGKKLSNSGEYFDFTVKSSITGNTDINYEIAAKEENGNTFAGKNVKFYLTKVNSDGSEEEAMPPKTYSEDPTSNVYTEVAGKITVTPIQQTEQLTTAVDNAKAAGVTVETGNTVNNLTQEQAANPMNEKANEIMEKIEQCLE